MRQRLEVAVVIRALSLLATLSALMACAGETASSPTPTPPQPTPVILPSATPTIVPQLSAIDLKQALISRSNLRQVWYDSEDPMPDVQPSNRCATAATLDAPVPTASASVRFSMSSRGPWVTEKLMLHPDRDTAADALGALRAAFECGEWVSAPIGEPETDQAESGTGKSAASPEPLGSPTAEPAPELTWSATVPSDLDLRAGAFLAGLTSQARPSVEAEFVAVQENNLLVVISHWSHLEIDTDVTMSFVDLAIERLDE